MSREQIFCSANNRPSFAQTNFGKSPGNRHPIRQSFTKQPQVNGRIKMYHPRSLESVPPREVVFYNLASGFQIALAFGKGDLAIWQRDWIAFLLFH
jgi:hypothetical protein